jgi:hypothetical protein
MEETAVNCGYFDQVARFYPIYRHVAIFIAAGACLQRRISSCRYDLHRIAMA